MQLDRCFLYELPGRLYDELYLIAQRQRDLQRAIFIVIVIEQTVRWYNAQYKTARWHKSRNNRLCIYPPQVYYGIACNKYRVEFMFCIAMSTQSTNFMLIICDSLRIVRYNKNDTWLEDEFTFVSTVSARGIQRIKCFSRRFLVHL